MRKRKKIKKKEEAGKYSVKLVVNDKVQACFQQKLQFSSCG